MELASGDKEKKYVYITVKLVKQQKKTLWLDLPRRNWTEKKNYRGALQNCLFIFHLLCLFLSLSWNFLPQLDCKYVSLSLLVSE